MLFLYVHELLAWRKIYWNACSLVPYKASKSFLALNIKSIPRWCASDSFAYWSTWQESWQTRLHSRESQNIWGSGFLRLVQLERRKVCFSGRKKEGRKRGHLSNTNSIQIPRVKKKKTKQNTDKLGGSRSSSNHNVMYVIRESLQLILIFSLKNLISQRTPISYILFDTAHSESVATKRHLWSFLSTLEWEVRPQQFRISFDPEWDSSGYCWDYYQAV